MTAELILTNARIYTLDPAQPWAEAVACGDGRVLAVGSGDDVLSLAGPETRIIDCGRHLVLPGLTDAHVHFLAYAVRRRQVSLFGLTDPAGVRERVAAAVAAAAPDEWVMGWGWDSNHWDVQPTAALIDDLSPRNPVVLTRMDMHTWWANSRAMDLAGVTAATPEPLEAHIGRYPDGRPSGLFSEWNAIDLIERHVPQPDEETLRNRVRETMAEAHSVGLTGIHDQRIEREGAQSLRLFQSLWRADELTLRVHCNVAADFLGEAIRLGLASGFGDDNLWLGHMKAFADGAMGSATAHMLEPYEGAPGNTGIVVTPPDELWSLIVDAADAGFPISVHAIGDRAVREVLDVMSEWSTTRGGNARLPMPQRIEHVQVIHRADLDRLAAHGIVASVQPIHLQSDWRTADRVWGERARYAYAFRSLLDRGTPLAFGSDAPVAPLNPLLGIHAAVTRQDATNQPAGGWYAAERLTVAEAIEGYTLGPARLSGKSDRFGSIMPGKYADLVMLSRNLFAIDPADIPTTTVRLTVFNGRVVYEG
ncbi:MAG: amidohydrolase [Anaerolineae bacterium]|nr:amidohydrolase [Anaerolineae bacterium]